MSLEQWNITEPADIHQAEFSIQLAQDAYDRMSRHNRRGRARLKAQMRELRLWIARERAYQVCEALQPQPEPQEKPAA